jgi:hypothetical protein
MVALAVALALAGCGSQRVAATATVVRTVRVPSGPAMGAGSLRGARTHGSPSTNGRGRGPKTDQPCDVTGISTPAEIRPTGGVVRCRGAIALWSAYLHQAPTRGQGSGGFLRIDGWECISAPNSEKPKLGTCARADRSASFAVYARGPSPSTQGLPTVESCAPPRGPGDRQVHSANLRVTRIGCDAGRRVVLSCVRWTYGRSGTCMSAGVRWVCSSERATGPESRQRCRSNSGTVSIRWLD